MNLVLDHPTNTSSTKRFVILRSMQVLAICLVILAITAGAGYLWWLFKLKPQPQIFAGINLYRQPIVVQIANEERRLDLFSTYSIEIPELNPGTITIKISDLEGNLLETRTHQITNQPGLAMDLFAAEGDFQNCPIAADASNIYYYQEVVETPQLRNITSLSDNAPVNSIFVTLGRFMDHYVWLGAYSGTHLPITLPTGQFVTGFYFVPCKIISSPAEIDDWAMWWKNFSPSQQIALYKERLAEIKADTSFR